jgi:hypothetical protein
MTTKQIILWSCAYLIELVAVVYFTRATARRVIGALVGGAAAGLFALGAIALCEVLGWWQIPFASTPYFLPLFYLGLSISLSRSTSSPGGWPAGSGGVAWRCAFAPWRSSGRPGIT